MEKTKTSLGESIQHCQYCGTNTIGGQRYCCAACEKLDSDFAFVKDHKESNPYLYLDKPDYAQTFINDNQYHFFIENLQCSSCVHLIEKIPDFYPDCKLARVNFGQNLLTVELTDKGQLSQVAKLIEDLGYQAYLIKKTDLESKSRNLKNRDDLKKIAVAGAVAGNLMIFAFAIYAGADGIALQFFRWMNLVLFLPLLLYSAQSFYFGAWNALKYRVIHIDLPIVIALVSSFAFSTYNLFIGSNDFYFDSTASFIFLILLARYFVKMTQQYYLSPVRLGSSLVNQKYTLLDQSPIVAEQIKVGDVFKVAPDQMIPVDGVLISPKALIDTSYYNGESMPQVFTEALQVYSGFKNLSESILIQAVSTMQGSQLNKLLTQTQDHLFIKNNYINLSDKLAQRLVTAVFSVAGLYFIGWGYFHSYQESFNRVLALIVVACPCALAFGSPLTMAIAFKKAQNKGIALRNANVFEKLNHIKNIFFDKTGTLTQGKLTLVQTWPDQINEELKSIILGLEKKSYHPVAFALRAAWKNTNVSPSLTNIKETFGSGVRGQVVIPTDVHDLVDTYEIKSLPENMHEDDLAVVVLKNGTAVARLYFNDELRQESKDLIHKLRNRHLNCYLLTGDKKSRAFQKGQACGIQSDFIFSELYPEEKKEIVKKYHSTMMIGDGLNDALALSASDIGISVKGSSHLTIDSSDVLFLRGGLEPLLELFNIGLQADRTLKRNLALALIYNILAGTSALFGLINPFWAAVLMPMSTIIVLLSSLFGFIDWRKK
ncbi:MAG: heavy metal translocating P-type ATPase [Pseudobdellovibrio sp.]